MDAVVANWTRGAEGYADHLESWSTPLAVQLALSVGADAKACGSVLEVAAGSGAGAAFLQAARGDEPGSGFRHVVTDLVEPMVSRIRARLPPHVEVQQANGEELPFPDASFDCYVACLALMITPDTSKMLKECHRVLKPGGRAAFAVWGDKAKSPMMTIPPQSLKACGFTPPAKRSNFHLGDDEAALRALVLEAGFSSMRSWRVHAMLPGATDPDAYISLMEKGSPSFVGLGAGLSDDERQRWFDEMRRRAQEVLDRGEAIGMDTLMFVATK
mmetsp:Transcript_139955/g.390181  ORF Transcript_139955/g.390181 Transcript_139955/m.390181 type:complete len:272 (+) Transcript_139955:100-915(+)